MQKPPWNSLCLPCAVVVTTAVVQVVVNTIRLEIVLHTIFSPAPILVLVELALTVLCSLCLRFHKHLLPLKLLTRLIRSMIGCASSAQEHSTSCLNPVLGRPKTGPGFIQLTIMGVCQGPVGVIWRGMEMVPRSPRCARKATDERSCRTDCRHCSITPYRLCL